MFSKSIKGKLLELLIVVSVTLLVSGVLSYSSINPIKTQWTDYQKDIAKRQALLLEIKSQFGYGGIIHNFKNYVIRYQNKYYDRLIKDFKKLDKTISEYAVIDNITQEEKESLEAIRQVAEQYRQATETVKGMIFQGKSIFEVDQVVKIDDTPAINAFGVLKKHYQKNTESVSVSITDKIINGQFLLIASSLFVIVFIGISIFIIGFSVSNGLNQFKNTLDKSIKNKDLSLRIKGKYFSELHEIAQTYNDFVREINQLINQSLISTIDVNDAASVMTEVANDTRQGIKSQEIETIEVTANLDQMVTAITTVAGQSQQAADLAVTAKTQSEEGRKIVEDTIDSIQSLSHEIDDAQVIINALEKQSHEIQGIVSVIQSIAEQTNLLALNAAIEAARAGEAGRGFAVVADEVRNLAQKTHEETNGIESIIQQLKASTETAVNAMKVSNDKATQGVDYVNQTGESLRLIADSVKQITDINTEIAKSTVSQVGIFENLSTNMKTNVKQFTMMLSDSVEYTGRASTQLNASTADLQKNIDVFTIDANPQLQLYKAKSQITAWKNRIIGYINGYIELDKSDTCNYKDCDFAQWYYSNDTAYLNDLEEFKAIEKPHIEQHEKLEQLLKLVSGSADEQEIDNLAHEIFLLNNNIENSIDALAQKLGIVRSSEIKSFAKNQSAQNTEIEFF